MTGTDKPATGPGAGRHDDRDGRAWLAAQFPGVTVWFGTYTRRWWALPPTADRLIEAATPRELAARLAAVWERTCPPDVTPAPAGWHPYPAR